MSRLFVYGTLMRGQSHAQLLAASRFVCDARTVAGFRLVDLNEYPGMVVGGQGAVTGEVFLVGDDLLATLDRYEGHPELFVRSIIALQGGTTAQAYVLRSERGRAGRHILSGDWRKRDPGPPP